MVKKIKNRIVVYTLKWLFVSLLLPCCLHSEPMPGNYQEAYSPLVLKAFNKAYFGEFELVFRGDYISLYTSGRLIKQDKHPKSSVWNVPSRKLKEMWVKRGEESPLIRLDPKTFRTQLLELLKDFPEIHQAILHKRFTYKGLPKGVVDLDSHIAKVVIVRQKKAGFKAGK